MSLGHFGGKYLETLIAGGTVLKSTQQEISGECAHPILYSTGTRAEHKLFSICCLSQDLTLTKKPFVAECCWKSLSQTFHPDII